MGTVHFVTGRGPVLDMVERLKEFARCCVQSDAVQDLSYFLSKPGALPRLPHLLLVGTAELDMRSPQPEELLGAVLIFEQQLCGVGLGAFATNDRSGRGSLLAREPDRALVAGLAARALMRRGAHLVLMSFRAGDAHETQRTLERSLAELRGRRVMNWAWRERSIPAYLPLSTTLDATLATLGARTRRNLRYYRRRAESDLGASFVPQLSISREELLAFNRHCMYAVSPQVAGWRYDSLQELDGPVLMGTKDGEGRWLSLLGGRRYLDRSEILWQMNRDGLKEYSLGTVMRSYFLEQEVARGSRRLYAEGGTHHSMSHSFVQESVTDLIVRRNTLAAKAMQLLARRYIPPDNELSRMLLSPTLEWRPC